MWAQHAGCEHITEGYWFLVSPWYHQEDSRNIGMRNSTSCVNMVVLYIDWRWLVVSLEAMTEMPNGFSWLWSLICSSPPPWTNAEYGIPQVSAISWVVDWIVTSLGLLEELSSRFHNARICRDRKSWGEGQQPTTSAHHPMVSPCPCVVFCFLMKMTQATWCKSWDLIVVSAIYFAEKRQVSPLSLVHNNWGIG